MNKSAQCLWRYQHSFPFTMKIMIKQVRGYINNISIFNVYQNKCSINFFFFFYYRSFLNLWKLKCHLSYLFNGSSLPSWNSAIDYKLYSNIIRVQIFYIAARHMNLLNSTFSFFIYSFIYLKQTKINIAVSLNFFHVGNNLQCFENIRSLPFKNT